MSVQFDQSARTVLTNARRLIDEAVNLEFEEPPTTSFYLIQLAQEEASKAFLLGLVHRGVIPWDNHILRACRDHKCKQLLLLVMDYLNPSEGGDFREHIEKLVAQHFSEVPMKIADAIHILRYEKIGRWQSSSWVWAEDPKWDSEALKVADGAMDSIKQDAIYVRLGRDGSIASTPFHVKVPKYSEQRDSANRMVDVVKALLGETIAIGGLEKIEEIFRALFTETREAKSA
jgi:AbiV family abortive infection protein